MTSQHLRALRKKLKMSQINLARYLGLRDKSQVSHMESGVTRICGPKLQLLKLLEATNGRVLMMFDMDGEDC